MVRAEDKIHCSREVVVLSKLRHAFGLIRKLFLLHDNVCMRLEFCRDGRGWVVGDSV